MIAEDLLERGLAGLASEYDVPVDGPDRISELLTPSVEEVEALDSKWRLHRPTTRGWLILAAAGLVIIVIASFAVGGGGSNNHLTTEAGSSNDAVGSVGGGVASAPRAPLTHRLLQPTRNAAPSVAAPGAASGATTFAPVNGGTAVRSDHGSSVAPVPSVPDKIIKTGELDLQVGKDQVSATIGQLTGLATAAGGYVADSTTSEGGLAPSGRVTLRVPVAGFDATVNKARNIKGVKVLSLETSGRDVTSKFVDLKARISALEKTRRTFLTILSRATTIGETLAVQQHITDVQTQIEQLTGQKKVLVNQAALSTLTVTVDQKIVTHATKTHHKSGLHKAVDRSVSRFVHGIEAIVGIIGPLLLAALLIALFWFVGRFGYRALRRRIV